MPLWKIVGGVPDKVNKEYIKLALSDYISDRFSKYKPPFNPKMCTSHLWSIKTHINPFFDLEFQTDSILCYHLFPPKLTHSGHMLASEKKSC